MCGGPAEAVVGEAVGEEVAGDAAKGAADVAGPEQLAGPGMEAEAAGAAAGSGGTSLMGSLKAAAPLISAGASAIGAFSGLSAAAAAKKAAGSGVTPAVPATPQMAVDPDLTAIRKKNALLFGLDAPGGTDITKGGAGTGDLGRTTLLGGTSSLGS